ncbi:protein MICRORCHIDIA 7-like [Rosa rugosa]|uniref:protein MICRORCHIDIA 7-like n=1 Tax=Rosa rugosa TaxID=74645 RepID=UPI002B4023A3|nr:protein MICRORCHIDIA 7-like [Rosa rugosa]
MPASAMGKSNNNPRAYGRQSCTKQFWKAGEYEGAPRNTRRQMDSSSTSGFDHARMHPKFLHSNATSHKWALGAFAELLDNALDEVHSGATYVNVDVLDNKKDGSKMLLVEDNGGGMDPEKMRKCMSLGYSEKSKMADTIGQYGNGFKTSTMRLGADVIVFSRSDRTQSIGLLSYTFLRSTAKEDIVVPILDYERRRRNETWGKMFRSSSENWDKSLETILEWSPFESERDLDHQFYMMKQHGTRIIIYNLWEDDEGNLELDLDTEAHDIQMRGVNRDEKNIQMAEQYPNSRHFLTYRHSLRSYAAILYLRLPTNFRIILRGKDVEHHNILNDLMWSEQITYRPKPIEKEETYIAKKTKKEKKDTNMVAEVTLGFVKDAKNHLDVQGFNVYHRNRLITPFWRVWNAAGSDGRGVIGVIEADYINPAHDKQGFEHTLLLDRLKQKLVETQKAYWSTNCHKIGYAPRRNVRAIYEEREAAKSGSQRPVLDSNPDKSSSRKTPVLDSNPDESPSSKRPVLDSNRDETSSRKRPVLDSNLDKSSSRKRSLPDLNTNEAKSPPHKSQKVSSDKSPNANADMHKKNKD